MKYVLFCLFLITVSLPAHAQRIGQMPGMDMGASGEQRIVAVVNDNVISTADIEARMKLAMISSNLPDSPEARQHLLPQILRALVDEQLELQEAKRLDISVSDEEVDKALERIAHDNNIQGDMRSYIAAHGGSADALVAQIRAGISWSKVVARELRPRVDVGDDEIDAYIERIRANTGKEEYLVSEILLAVDNPQDEEQVKQFAENLTQQLKSGANFGGVARQFSQGTGAASGGDIGWIQEGQLAPELDHALVAMPSGDIEGPIRTANGYHILGLRDKRVIALGSSGEVTLNLQQVFRPYDAGANKDTLTQEATLIRTAVNNCSNLQSTLTEKFPAWRASDMGDVAADKMPGEIAEKVRGLQPGQSSEPIDTDKGELLIFVCGRKVPEGNVNREAITATIGTEKLELQARRLLRDLRRSAYLDLRISGAPS